jgi:hypothetical protein
MILAFVLDAVERHFVDIAMPNFNRYRYYFSKFLPLLLPYIIAIDNPVSGVTYDSPISFSTSNETRVAVTVFTGHHVSILMHTLRHFDSYLDASWRIQIFFQKALDISRVLNVEGSSGNSSWLRAPRFIFSYAGEHINDVKTLSSYMVTNVSFWESIVGDRILIFQADSAICSQSPYSVDQFLHYDYIGAPWPYLFLIEDFIRTYDFGYLRPIDTSDNGFYGGNGGFSIRSKSSMIECAKAAVSGVFFYKIGFPEDIWFSYCLKTHLVNAILPTRSTQLDFCTETNATRVLSSGQPSFGTHKVWLYLEKAEWDSFIAVCPEIAKARDVYAKSGRNVLINGAKIRKRLRKKTDRSRPRLPLPKDKQEGRNHTIKKKIIVNAGGNAQEKRVQSKIKEIIRTKLKKGKSNFKPDHKAEREVR